MEDERDLTVGVMALTMLLSGATSDKAGPEVVASLNTELQQQNAQLISAERITNAAAKSAATAVGGIGSAFPASIQAKAANVLVQIAYIPGLRAGAPTEQQLLAGVAAEQPVQVIDGYSGVLSILFALDNEITTGSGDVALGDDVRALSALSQAEDQASQQRAILYGALLDSALNNAGTKTHFNNVGGPAALGNFGGLDALITAEDLQFADQQSFQAVATTGQTQAFLNGQGGDPAGDAQLIENLVTTAGDPTVIFPLAKGIPKIGYSNAATAPVGWFNDMSTIINGMRDVDDQLAGAIVARSQFAPAPGLRVCAGHRGGRWRWRCSWCCWRRRWSPGRWSTRCAGCSATRWRSPRSGCPRGWRPPPAGPSWPRRTRPRSTGSSRSACRRPTRSAASPARSTRSTPRRCGWPAPRRSCAATSTRCSSACPGAACR